MTRSPAEPHVDRLPDLPLPDASRYPFDPPPEYARLRAESPVLKVACPTGITAWLVTGYADARAVLSDSERFSTRPGPAAHILTYLKPDDPVWEGQFARMDGPDHLRFRRYLAPEVSTPKRLAELRPLVQRIVDERLDALATAPHPVDLYADFARPTTTSVLAEMLTVPYSDRALFHQASGAVFDMATTGEELERAMAPLFEYLFGLVARRRAEPGDDAISRMIARAEASDRPFTELEVVMAAGTLLVAGLDTTASLVAHGLLMLLTHPDELARLRERPEWTATAGDELVRYLSVGVGLLREVVTDTEIGGQRVAAGDFVVVAVQAANRDPALCPDPDRFDVGRTGVAHLGFGHGPHQCIGRPLAQVQVAAVLGTVTRRIPTLRLAVPLSEISFRDDLATITPRVLPVTWDELRPAS